MTHQGTIEADGEVIEVLPNTLFRVQTRDGKVLLCHLAGKLRMNYIRVMPGDRVKIETTNYDPDKGRIILRYK